MMGGPRLQRSASARGAQEQPAAGSKRTKKIISIIKTINTFPIISIHVLQLWRLLSGGLPISTVLR